MANLRDLLKPGAENKLHQIKQNHIFSFAKERRGYKLIKDLRDSNIDAPYYTFCFGKEYMFPFNVVKQQPNLFWYQRTSL